MISWSRLLSGRPQESDSIRFRENPNYIPSIVVWNITSRCNQVCLHCYFDADCSNYPYELDLDEGKSVIDDLSKFGVSVLLFSGGEPLLREDIYELGCYATQRRLRSILSSNGTLITKDVAKRLKEVGFSYIGISLDGLPETNDSFRRVRGSFNSTLNGIRNCIEVGLKVGLRFTITRFNYKELSYIFDIVESEGIQRLCIYHMVYTGRGKYILDMDISHNQRRQILELIWCRVVDFLQRNISTEVLTVDNHADGVWLYLRLLKIEPARAKEALRLLSIQGGNSSGIKIGALDNYGNVYPDQFWRRYILGNVRLLPFSKIWSGDDSGLLYKLRNRTSLLKGRCRSCDFQVICNGNFRARAEAVFDDPWAEDPSCYLTDEELHL